MLVLGAATQAARADAFLRHRSWPVRLGAPRSQHHHPRSYFSMSTTTEPPNTARDARAQAKAEKAYRKAQRPWYKKKRFIIPVLLVLLIIVIAATSGGSDNSNN